MCAHVVQSKWWGEFLPTGQEFCTFINLSWWTHFASCSETPTDTKHTLYCEPSEQHRRHEGRELTVRASLPLNYTPLPFKLAFKAGKLCQMLLDWLFTTPIFCTLHSAFFHPHHLSVFLCVCVQKCRQCSHVPSQSIFSNTLDLHLELQAVFTQSFQKGAINNSTKTCYVIPNVV